MLWVIPMIRSRNLKTPLKIFSSNFELMTSPNIDLISKFIKGTFRSLFWFVAGFAFFLSSSPAKQKKPEWVVNYGSSTKYPTSQFLTGFGVCSGTSADAKEIAQDNSRADLSRSILVNVSSMLSTLKKEEEQHLSQELSSITQSSTSLNLMGLKTELFVDDDKKNPMTYAFGYVKRSTLLRIYGQKRAELRNEIRQIVELAESHQDQKDQAIKYYLQSLPILDALKEVETILSVAAQASSIVNAFDELEGELPLVSRTEIMNKTQQLALEDIASINDIAHSIAFQFNQQIPLSERSTMVVPYTYQDTKMTSQFSRYLQRDLEVALENVVSQTRRFRAKSTQVMRDIAVASGANCLLSGSYWETEGEVRVLAVLRDVQTGKSLASARVEFSPQILPTNIELKPQNFEAAMVQQQAFAEGEIIDSQLQVEVWTSKGNENVLFNDGEEMQIYLRVNRQAYVRLLYILADGSKTLLFDGLYIDQSKVNHVVEVPEVFECANPFGAEMLVAVARTLPFDLLETEEIDGYFFIQSDNPKEVADLTRGVKGLRRKKKKNLEVQQSESKMTITTIP